MGDERLPILDDEAVGLEPGRVDGRITDRCPVEEHHMQVLRLDDAVIGMRGRDPFDLGPCAQHDGHHQIVVAFMAALSSAASSASARAAWENTTLPLWT